MKLIIYFSNGTKSVYENVDRIYFTPKGAIEIINNDNSCIEFLSPEFVKLIYTIQL